MFRCFLRPRSKLLGPTKCLPSLASPGSSRGIKLSRLTSVSRNSEVPLLIPPYGPFTRQGRAHLTRLLENDVGLYTELQPVKSLDWRGVYVKLAPRHTVAHSDLRYFSDVGHGYAEAIVRRHLDSRDKPLWLMTGAKGAADNKSIVRGRAKYRVNAALKQALRNAGYDADGRRLSEEAWQRHVGVVGGRPGRREGISQLYGTVEVIVRDPKQIHAVKFVDLRAYCQSVVRTLEEQIGLAEDGRRPNRRSSDRPRAQNQFQRGRPSDGGNKGKPNQRPGFSGRTWQPGRGF